MTVLGMKRERRGEKGIRKSIAGVPNILPREEKWKLYEKFKKL